MKKNVVFGIMILLAMLIISPVAACHLEVTVAGQKEECTTCDFYTYDITAKSVAGGEGDTNYLVMVKDKLPEGVEFVSYSDEGPVSETAECADPAPSTLDSTCRVIQWNYNNVPHNAEWAITLKVRPVGKSDGDSVTNLVKARWKHRSGDSLSTPVSSSVNTLFKDDICPIPSPEFPTMAVPAALIVGMLGAVLFIRRT